MNPRPTARAGSTAVSNLDPDEIAKFSALAADWWDREVPSRTLHEINPCRVEFIELVRFYIHVWHRIKKFIDKS